MLKLKSQSYSTKIDKIIISTIKKSINKDCQKVLKYDNIDGKIDISYCKNFNSYHLLNLKSYIIELYDDHLLVVLIHENFNVQYVYEIKNKKCL